MVDETELVLRERRGAIEVLTLNRPDKRNALNAALREAIITALEASAADVGVRAIVLTGAGDKAFVAGADVTEFAGRDVAAQAATMLGRRVYDVVAAVERPVIAAINGACLGGGLETALACRYRICTDHPKTTFSVPEVQLGLIPGMGGTQRSRRICRFSALL